MVKSGKFNYNEKENMETFKLTAEKNVLNDKTKQIEDKEIIISEVERDFDIYIVPNLEMLTEIKIVS